MNATAADLRALVEGHQPQTPREASAQARFLEELARLPAPCDEHADLTHVTASGIVVGRRGTVLHLHKRLGIWMQPGGHIDAGETPRSRPGARPSRSWASSSSTRRTARASSISTCTRRLSATRTSTFVTC